jgi:hypothetical protein
VIAGKIAAKLLREFTVERVGDVEVRVFPVGEEREEKLKEFRGDVS